METGAFLSIDPVESEPPYLYARGNPIRWTDHSGFSPKVACENMPTYLNLRELCFLGNGDDNDPTVLDAREEIFRTMVKGGSTYGIFNESFLWGSKMLEHFLDGNGSPMNIRFSIFNAFTNDPGITRATKEERPPRFPTDEPSYIRPLLHEFVYDHIQAAANSGTQFTAAANLKGKNYYTPSNKRPRPYSKGFWAAFGHVAIDGTFSADVQQSCTYEGYFAEYTANYHIDDRYEWFEGTQTPFSFPFAPGVVRIPHEWELSLVNATPSRAHEYPFAITWTEKGHIFIADDFSYFREISWWEWESQYGHP